MSINIYQISRHRPKYGVEYYRNIRINQNKTRDLGSVLKPAVLISLCIYSDKTVLRSYRLTKQSCRKNRFISTLGLEEVEAEGNSEKEMMDNAGKKRKCGEWDEIQTTIPAQKLRGSHTVFVTGKLQKYLQ